MASYLKIALQDGDGRIGYTRIPVADVDLPVGYATLVGDVLAVFGGTTNAFLTQATVKSWAIEIVTDVNAALPAAGDIRNGWKVGAFAALTPGADPFTFQVPGRNTNPVLTLASSKNVLIDPSQPAWTAFVAALAPAGVDLVDPDNDDSAALTGAKAIVTQRVNPRV